MRGEPPLDLNDGEGSLPGGEQRRAEGSRGEESRAESRGEQRRAEEALRLSRNRDDGAGKYSPANTHSLLYVFVPIRPISFGTYCACIRAIAFPAEIVSLILDSYAPVPSSRCRTSHMCTCMSKRGCVASSPRVGLLPL